MKLDDLMALMLCMSRVIIVIECYPSTYLRDYDLSNYEIIWIDPRLPKSGFFAEKYPKHTIVQGFYDFTSLDFIDIIQTRSSNLQLSLVQVSKNRGGKRAAI